MLFRSLVTFVSNRTTVRDDTAIGLLFVGMLALGVVIVSKAGSFKTDVRVWHIANGLEYDKSFQSRLMAENRLHISNGESIYTKLHEEHDGYSIPVAYHLDSHKVGEYLKRKALEKSNCSHVEGKVVALAQDRDGSIHHLVLDDDREVEADFYIDCSGFSRILINNITDNNFISYDNDLLVDSALVFTRDSNDIKNYTQDRKSVV